MVHCLKRLASLEGVVWELALDGTLVHLVGELFGAILLSARNDRPDLAMTNLTNRLFSVGGCLKPSSV